MKLSKRRIARFQSSIFSWWDLHKRDLPWRLTHDPYKILISEVMLQQTQVDRVLPKYDEFLYFFPDVYALAHTTPAKVLKIWRGMGYNRRALYLRKAAQIIVEEFHGYFPNTELLLSKLPGVGTYTARALLVFAFGKNVAAVDTNIRKIITHLFFHGKAQKESTIDDVARQLLPQEKPWEWHQAMMDYGALALPKRRIREPELNDQKKRRIPFRQTDRYYRGRIVDRLREGDVREAELLKHFAKQYQKPKNFLQSIIQGLERDGLVARTKGNVLRLPT